MKKYALIVAGGKGLRMGKTIPKQFMELASLPVLMHTIEAFKSFDDSIVVILVLPHDHIAYWKTLCEKYSFDINHCVIEGGNERFFSVKNGLDAIDDGNSVVAIHDGVRPLVSKETLQTCFETAERFGSAIPVIESVNSVRIIEGEESAAIDRASVRLVQTPQTFITREIKDAFTQQYSVSFTDDAAVYEAYGKNVHLVDGNMENIKITHQEDFLIAKLYMNHGKHMKEN